MTFSTSAITTFWRNNHRYKSWIICVIKYRYNPSAPHPVFHFLGTKSSHLNASIFKSNIQLVSAEPWVCICIFIYLYICIYEPIVIDNLKKLSQQLTHGPSAWQRVSKTNKQLNHSSWKGLLDPITLCCLISYIQMINWTSEMTTSFGSPALQTTY